MVYKFFNFYLDVAKKELFFEKEKLHLTQQNFKLLKVFLENSDKTLNKSQLIDEVWNGRAVEDNTVDQAFSKLRKILNSQYKTEYFEVGYGKGWKFLPQVVEVNSVKSTFKMTALLFSILLIALILIGYYFWNKKEQQTNKSLE